MSKQEKRCIPPYKGIPKRILKAIKELGAKNVLAVSSEFECHKAISSNDKLTTMNIIYAGLRIKPGKKEKRKSERQMKWAFDINQAYMDANKAIAYEIWYQSELN